MSTTSYPLTLLLSLLAFLAPQLTMAQQTNGARILIYSATADFRHDSIPTAVNALVQHGPAANISFDHTEDKTWFVDDTLAQYDAVLFLMNTGEGEHPPICLGWAAKRLTWHSDSFGRFWQDCTTEVLGPWWELCCDPCSVGRTAEHHLVPGRSG